jgi:hypothetical protein
MGWTEWRPESAKGRLLLLLLELLLLLLELLLLELLELLLLELQLLGLEPVGLRQTEHWCSRMLTWLRYLDPS